MSYIPVINATQVWLTINPNLFTPNVFFLSWYDMSIVRLSLFLGLQLLEKKTGSVYKGLNLSIHDERNLDYGFQFKHEEVFSLQNFESQL